MIEFSWAAMFPTKTITVEEENRFGDQLAVCQDKSDYGVMENWTFSGQV